MIDGITVHMAGADWVVPPLSFKALKRALPALAGFASTKAETQIEALVSFLHAALARNYPDLTPSALEDMLELRDRPAIMAALPQILDLSGLTARGGTPQPGELAAPPPASTGTG